jgi:hypothetical protein
MDSPASPKDEIWFLRVRHHISTLFCKYIIIIIIIIVVVWMSLVTGLFFPVLLLNQQ